MKELFASTKTLCIFYMDLWNFYKIRHESTACDPHTSMSECCCKFTVLTIYPFPALVGWSNGCDWLDGRSINQSINQTWPIGFHARGNLLLWQRGCHTTHNTRSCDAHARTHKHMQICPCGYLCLFSFTFGQTTVGQSVGMRSMIVCACVSCLLAVCYAA